MVDESVQGEEKKSMRRETLVALCQYLAEQSYMNHLLVKRLIAAKVLRQGELQHLYEENPQEREAFFRDYLAHLASLGLKPEES